MRIGIIGAGNVGRALSRAAVRAGHAVAISSTKFPDAERVAAETGAEAARSNRDVAEASDIIILAVLLDSVDGIILELGSTLFEKILVDVTNRREPQQIDGTSNAEIIQAKLPGTYVIKAFNTAFAARQAEPVVDGIPVDGFVAGDDETPKAQVLELVRSIGFRPIDAGPLAMARALEAMAILNISLNVQNGWPWQSGWKLLSPAQQPARV